MGIISLPFLVSLKDFEIGAEKASAKLNDCERFFEFSFFLLKSICAEASANLNNGNYIRP